MTVEELRKTRFKVIQDYPKSPFQIGTILMRIPYATNDWFSPPQDEYNEISLDQLLLYPKIFEQMLWWEDCEIEDMPEYIKRIEGNMEVINVAWEYQEGILKAKNLEHRQIRWFRIIDYKGTRPATKEEYEAYKSQQA